jgi:dienelactone hydrolase
MTDIDLSAPARVRKASHPLRGYLSNPSGPGPWPGVVLIHEIFGLDDVMRRHADRADVARLLLVAPVPQDRAHRHVSTDRARSTAHH